VSQENPRLSIFIGARNDTYMGNYRWRLETTLNYLAASLEQIGRLNDVEVIITDWNSDVPLHRVLKISPTAQSLVRYVVVPPAIARKAQGDSEFPIVLAQNTAVRRARGEYIAQTDSDVLFTPEFLTGLFELLEEKRTIDVPVEASFLVSMRRDVPYWYAANGPTIKELDWFLQRYGESLPPTPYIPIEGLGNYTATGFVMMHRRLWEEVRGYDERLVHWGWMDIDLALRVARDYAWRYLRDAGLPEVFHLEHYSPWLFRRPTRQVNPMNHPTTTCPNPETWGLADETLEIVTYPASLRGEREGALPPQRSRGRWITTMRVRMWLWWRRTRAPLKKTVNKAVRRILPRRVYDLLSLWGSRASVFYWKISGQPASRWPSIARQLWTERKQRWRGRE
jgi:uncharacterized protein (UPF0248 family)